MPVNPTTYPFDPSGTLASNQVTGEQHIITEVNYKDYNLLVPTYAPFFATSLSLSYKDINATVIPLVENVDYYLTHWFLSASRACSKPIYGSITLLNTNISGVITLSYQTLGGDWNIDSQQIATIVADTIHNPRITTWEQVANLPYAFPVIDHPWDLVDMVGMSDVVNKLEDIHQAIIDSTGGSGSSTEAELQAHISDHNNPHQVTAAQVGALTQAQADTLYLGKSAQAADSALFNGKTYSQAKADILTGKAADTNLFSGMTVEQVISQAQSEAVDNATHFDNRTFAEATTEILSGQAADSLRFNGKTESDRDTEIGQMIDDNISMVKRIFPVYISTDPMAIDSWTLLATFYNNTSSGAEGQSPTIHLLIDVGSYATDTVDYSYEVFVNARAATPELLVNTMRVGQTASTFGISFDSANTQYQLWIKTKAARSFVCVTSLGGGNIASADIASSVTDTEPTAIDYTLEASSEGYVTVEQFNTFIDALTAKFTTLSTNQ